MAATLSDEAWADICAAAERTPDSEARATLSVILFNEYPAFAYDRARVAAALKRSQRMLKQIEAFEADYRAQFPTNNDMTTERDLWCIEGLRRCTKGIWLVAQAIRRANEGRKSAQREWLYHRLCTVWLDNFHAPELTYSRPKSGGKPSGPLIKFMFATMKLIISKRDLPSRESVRDAIDRERHERANLKLLIQKRGMGD